jgi:hypothetical protein
MALNNGYVPEQGYACSLGPNISAAPSFEFTLLTTASQHELFNLLQHIWKLRYELCTLHLSLGFKAM